MASVFPTTNLVSAYTGADQAPCPLWLTAEIANPYSLMGSRESTRNVCTFPGTCTVFIRPESQSSIQQVKQNCSLLAGTCTVLIRPDKQNAMKRMCSLLYWNSPAIYTALYNRRKSLFPCIEVVVLSHTYIALWC